MKREKNNRLWMQILCWVLIGGMLVSSVIYVLYAIAGIL